MQYKLVNNTTSPWILSVRGVKTRKIVRRREVDGEVFTETEEVEYPGVQKNIVLEGSPRKRGQEKFVLIEKDDKEALEKQEEFQSLVATGRLALIPVKSK